MALPIDARERFRRADFFVSPTNAAALAAIDGWRDWPGGMMLLVGPEGAGKTHLARIWAEETGAGVADAAGIAAQSLPELAASGVLVVENADSIAGDPASEEALFHLYNLGREQGMHLLFTARTPPRDWGLGLADLKSRMQSLSLARIAPPDDALLSAVLAKLFADRQVKVAPTLIPYLVARMERSIDAARRLVAELDRRALARGGPISRADATILFSEPLDRPDAE